MELLSLESIVKTQLETRVKKSLGSKYPKLSFTTKQSVNTPSFPNVYVHELEPSELGNSIENDQIHALRDTIQINVSTNTTKAEAKEVANACVKVMKLLRYNIVVFPTHMQSNNIHTYVIRARRVVALGDNF